MIFYNSVSYFSSNLSMYLNNFLRTFHTNRYFYWLPAKLAEGLKFRLFENKIKLRTLKSRNSIPFFPVKIANITPQEILFRWNREIKYQWGKLCIWRRIDHVQLTMKNIPSFSWAQRVQIIVLWIYLIHRAHLEPHVQPPDMDMASEYVLRENFQLPSCD